jgi:type I restriction enzyme S subunit
MTEIGEIPEDWKVAKLGDDKVSELIMGQSPPSSFYNNDGDGMPFLQGNADFGDIYPNPNTYCTKPLKIAESGDILMSVRAPVGELNISAFKSIIGRGLAAIRCKDKITHSKYLYYYLKYSVPRLRSLSTGSTFKEVGKDILSNFEICLPEFEEQQKIAEILSTADESIQKVTEKITITERLKKGLMQTLLTKGIGHTKFKMTEIGEIPEDWVIDNLGNLVEIMDSRRVPLSQIQREGKKRLYPYCGANGIIDYIDDFIFDEETVLLAEDGGIYGKYEKKAYVMNGKYWVNNHAHVIRGKKGKMNNKFIHYWLNFSNLNAYINGSTRTKLNQDSLKNILIPKVSLFEQQKIAEILSTVDDKLELLKNKREHLGKLKKGLMDDLLTGRVRVKT